MAAKFVAIGSLHKENKENAGDHSVNVVVGVNSMDLDSANLTDVERYLRSFGGSWATLQVNLAKSLRDMQPSDGNWPKNFQDQIKKVRDEEYEHVVRAFARLCQQISR